MQIVIEIPDEEYREIRQGHKTFNTELYLLNGVLEGTPLPKGHGRLIDADKRRTEIDEENRWVVDLAETIVEAEKEKT